MSDTKVLNPKEEYMFLKKVCPRYDEVLKYKDESPGIAMTRSEWKDLRNLVACLLMLDAGLRVGEMVQIRYTDVYFQLKPVKCISVRAEIAKGKVQRTIPVSERLRAALRLYRPNPLLMADWP
ncbi:site-specific integrase, partial [Candidatus Pacearchaeota archaeon]|nr:site-specific integrase [Candidatus Pacearchaeota archaeon]